MFIISKTIKGNEYMYSKRYTILCKNEALANKLANFLNLNNDTSIGDFKLKDNEIWHTYQIDEWDTPPKYKLKTTRNRISISLYEEV